jgi:hypothetical protein
LHFELHGIDGGLQKMDVAVVGGDDELAITPRGILVSADQKLQGELFEDVIVKRLGDRDRKESRLHWPGQSILYAAITSLFCFEGSPFRDILLRLPALLGAAAACYILYRFANDAIGPVFGGRNTITFDMKMINNMFTTNEGINPAYKASTGWGEIVAHEGAHMLDRFAFGNPVNRSGALRTETNAFDTQSFVPKALNVQSQWGLWNPGWKEADRETLRKAAVQSEAQRDVDLNWRKKK